MTKTDAEKAAIAASITQNVTAIADDYPDVEFYCFVAPYSAAWWSGLSSAGTVRRHIDVEQCVIEAILGHDNIHLFSFNDRTDITADLNNYPDTAYYGTWINSLILKWMSDGEHELTEGNYLDYLERERDFYTTFDYSTMNTQEDYDTNLYAAALVNRELTGAEPVDLLAAGAALSGAELERDTDGSECLVCTGRLARSAGGAESLADWLRDTEYIGARIDIPQLGGHKYLTFSGKKLAGNGQPSVYVYGADGEVIARLEAYYQYLDGDWHTYAVDLSDAEGGVTAILNGGFTDASGREDSAYAFRDVMLY